MGVGSIVSCLCLVSISVLAIIILVISNRSKEKAIKQDTAQYGHCEVCGGSVRGKWLPCEADKQTGKILKYKLHVVCQGCGHRQRIEKYIEA